MASNEHYRGKIVVITGASSGFGRGAAVELARRGCAVVLAARSVATLNEVARECEEAGGKALVVPTDVSDRAAVEKLASEAVREFGHFDTWINDAGVAAIGQFDQIPLEDHEQVIKTDLLGTVYGSHLAMTHFHELRRGTLINVASVIGKIPAPLYASYTASKFGIVGLCDALRQELKEQRNDAIRVCTVMPMAHSTEFFEHAGNYTGKKAVPIPPTYDPRVTVDALVKLVAEPEDEVITGWQGGPFSFLHRMMPKAIERLMARNTVAVQLNSEEATAPTSGNVHHASNK
ncbi:short-chain dehydrogenase : Short-chain dehydrogenase/reductase SDR OS=Solibacter usitatus (strain Ellin6076) GN=Acid_3006 PE=3 SV=1: adh_short [Gemmata massiliana]|uniref:Uncharacterized protein n=1 Tax=Gemmata massiliana TaxID=1210884 RepID=A0A6P2CV60_9BACT|nr:SDR family oxidoreductase [Gemmata massiliana]VTR92861.1 short-chain dehydrogenase : Short-chain dehydrogenase/reductase SDR OS=Solibacter usitatus (strain Ellin6076) GN=Acid_3006 PE=3 SV=1: adh_short [Gemmata massiliana]